MRNCCFSQWVSQWSRSINHRSLRSQLNNVYAGDEGKGSEIVEIATVLLGGFHMWRPNSRGVPKSRQKEPNQLISIWDNGGKRVKKSENFADFIYMEAFFYCSFFLLKFRVRWMNHVKRIDDMKGLFVRWKCCIIKHEGPRPSLVIICVQNAPILPNVDKLLAEEFTNLSPKFPSHQRYGLSQVITLSTLNWNIIICPLHRISDIDCTRLEGGWTPGLTLISMEL